MSATVTRIGGHKVVYAIVQDVSKRRARERTLESLRSATRELMAAETKADICEIATTVAGDTLGLPLAAVYLTADGQTLRPAAVTERTREVLDEIPSFERGNALAWSVFESSECAVFDDVKNEPGVYNPETPIEYEVILPLGEHGVFMVGSPTKTDLSEYVYDSAKTLAANVEAALDRAEREETLATQRTELTELNRINAVIRDVDRTLVQATSREEIETSVPERMVAIDTYRFAWVGEYDTTAGIVRPVAQAGTGDSYLEAVIDREDDVRDPATRALESEELVAVEDIATDPTFEPWREESLDREFRSLVAIPIRYDERCYGVLVVYADEAGAFDDRERTVLAELGETVGLTIAAIENKKALVSDCVTELELQVESADHFFVRIPRQTDCEFDLLGTTLSADGRLLCFVTATGSPPDEILELASRDETISDCQIVYETDEECLLQLTYEGKSLVEMLADRGGSVSHGHADENGARVLLELPRSTDVRRTVEAIRERFPNTHLVAQRERDRPEPTLSEFRTTLDESLSDRQLSALKTAYLAGFFDWLRTSTGEEVSALLDVSPPTFHQHLRRAQSKLLGAIFDR
ncbi:bacterio-opsin activator domain-containing protein [Haladaptatus sp. NG-WS-4]